MSGVRGAQVLDIEKRYKQDAGARKSLTPDQLVVEAVRECLGKPPLYGTGIEDRMPWLDSPWLHAAALNTVPARGERPDKSRPAGDDGRGKHGAFMRVPRHGMKPTIVPFPRTTR